MIKSIYNKNKVGRILKKNKSMISEVFEWIITIGITILLSFLLMKFVISTTIVDGISMEPTLKTGDRLMVNRIGLRFKDVEFGDIIEFHSPYDEKKDFIKRVIGVTGDTVDLINSRVYVNGEEIKEDYINEQNSTKIKNGSSWVIGEDEVFVLGDNRNHSGDSREFGPIKKDAIVGKAFFRFYPFNKIKLF